MPVGGKRPQRILERQQVYRAITVIIKARPYGTKYPVTPKEIEAFTRLDTLTVRSALEWLKKHLLIHNNHGGWQAHKLPERQLCWDHGRFWDHPTECPKCFRRKQHDLEVVKRREVDREEKLFKRVKRIQRTNGVIGAKSFYVHVGDGERDPNRLHPINGRPSWHTGLPHKNRYEEIKPIERTYKKRGA